MLSSVRRVNFNFSLAIIYIVHAATTFFAAPVIGILNAKWTMVLGGIPYIFFQLGFLYLNRLYLFTSSALVGTGASCKDSSLDTAIVTAICMFSVIWVAQGKYLAICSTTKVDGVKKILYTNIGNISDRRTPLKHLCWHLGNEVSSRLSAFSSLVRCI